MGDNGANGNTNGLPSGWRVEIGGGSPFPRGAYSMIELDARRCAFERPGGPSFEMLAADVVLYEKAGVLHAIGPLAGNDNSAAYATGLPQQYPKAGKFSISSKAGSHSRNLLRMRLMHDRTFER